MLCGSLLSVQEKRYYFFYVPGTLKVGCTWHPFLFLLVLSTVMTSDEILSTGCSWEKRSETEAQCIPAVMCCYNKNAYLF